MRIKGLLKALNRFRAQLRAGLEPDQAASFAARVRSLTRQVEEICARGGLTPEHLPGPSRMAYRFLKELDLEHLPVQQAGQAQPERVHRVAVRNVCAMEDSLADRFWQRLSPLLGSAGARAQMLMDIQSSAEAIEAICARQHSSPGALETPSRQAYCWLKFLSKEENLAAHLAALERARAALEDCPPRFTSPIVLHLVNMRALWRKRPYSNLVLFQVSEGFLNAEPEIWGALIQSMVDGRRSPLSGRIRAFADSDDFSEVLAEIESFAELPGASTQGCAHNLEASFARVNAGYFGGSMPRPRLVWNRTLTGRKFGHYQRSTDTVMLSVSLDAPAVPAWVVDYVLYHELLHKKHGFSVLNGRRFSHTQAFRSEERLFAEHEAAEHFLHRLARRAGEPAEC
ncbi:MAG TPA: hypothetical protein P5555_19970 [Candidatus Paceibacterota bacterium]|nr:hypothetical protein [Verrucomicrobiota bacterium]HRZ47462.1 hypothetical protein [Candidatus Paceibacterota bacterium]HRZ94483.1 hypothetical protein [Candidatus Paceibacterota bacterium]